LAATRKRDSRSGEYRFQTIGQLHLTDRYEEVRNDQLLGEPCIRALEKIRVSIYYRLVFVPREQLVADSRKQIAQVTPSLSGSLQTCHPGQSKAATESSDSPQGKLEQESPKPGPAELFKAIRASDAAGVKSFIANCDGEVAYIRGSLEVDFGSAYTANDTDAL